MFYSFEKTELYSCVELMSYTMGSPVGNVYNYLNRNLSNSGNEALMDNQYIK